MRRFVMLVAVLIVVCTTTSFGVTILIDSARSESENLSTIEFFENNFAGVTVVFGNYNDTTSATVQAAIEAADVFVIARGNRSTGYTTADTTYYSGLTIPVISLSSYFTRADNLNWEAGGVVSGSVTDNETSVTAAGAAVFGSAGDFDWWSGDSDFWGVGDSPAVGDGTILATMGGYNLVVGWDAGDTVNTGEVQSGSRLLFNLPSGNDLPDTAAGQAALINAVKVYAGLLGNVANPNPADGSTNQGVINGANVDVTLQWDGIEDTYNPGQIDPDVKKHYVYVDFDNTDSDPNLIYQGEVLVSGTTLSASWDLLSLAFDQSLSWQIEEGLDNGTGGVYAAGDPNNLMGPVWTFTTLPSVPVIDPQPESTFFDTGDADIVLTLSASSAYEPLTYQWYKDTSPISDGAEYQGTQTDTLMILTPDMNDEGDYYCKVTGNNGGFTDSDTAVVKMERLVAWYQFEEDTLDSVGANDANVIGGVPYTSDVLITSDGQAYAADPNGVGYAELPLGAYPSAGFGNALEQGSVCFWVKVSSTSQQAIMGSINDGTSMLFQLFVPSASNGAINLYMRDASGNDVNCATGDTSVADGQWHYIAVNYQANPGEIAIYFDGELTASATGDAMVDLAAWDYPMSLMARNVRGAVGSKFSGMLDDLKIYNYRLTSEDIAQVYYNVTGQQSCIVANYPSALDLSGPDSEPDCVIDLYDFALIASEWLESGLYPSL